MVVVVVQKELTWLPNDLVVGSSPEGEDGARQIEAFVVIIIGGRPLGFIPSSSLEEFAGGEGGSPEGEGSSLLECRRPRMLTRTVLMERNIVIG